MNVPSIAKVAYDLVPSKETVGDTLDELTETAVGSVVAGGLGLLIGGPITCFGLTFAYAGNKLGLWTGRAILHRLGYVEEAKAAKLLFSARRFFVRDPATVR